MSISDILHYWPEGKDRRKAIYTYMKENPDSKIYINRQYCRQLHLDKDLKKLVKKGILHKKREGIFACKTSYLVFYK